MRIRRLQVLLFISLFLSTWHLGAQEIGSNTETQPTPHLVGIVDLGSVSLLWGDSDDPIDHPEPLDIASTAAGPVLLFSDRILSLGVNLEMTRRTVQDLNALPQLPRGIVPSRLLLNPLSEPIIYDARTGTLDLLHLHGGDSERFETGFPQALEAESLRRGGVVLSDGKRLVLFTRRADRLTRREIPLGTAFTTGLSIDHEDRLWVYDLAARRVRVFDQSGEELFSVTPDISGGTLLFPQVFQVRPDGGFFLGTAGELWCFRADGSIRWRLTQFSAGFRQALPAFYRLAMGESAAGTAGEAMGGVESGLLSFYILDPLGNRVLKFIEDDPSASQTDAAIGAALAAAFRGFETGQSSQSEIVRLCLEEELYLQAAFFRRSDSQEPVVTDLGKRIVAKQARLLGQAGEQLENELRYGEAEAAYNQSLNLYRELRSLDPVDPRYPEAIRELSERRNTLRRIRVAESLLAASLWEGGPIAGAGKDDRKRELRIELTNTSGGTVEQVEVLARFSGYSVSRWQASVETIRPGRKVQLTITLPESGPVAQGDSARGVSPVLNGEDLSLPCNLLVRYVHDRQEAAQHFRLPVLFPAGTLRLPAAP